MMTGSAAAVGAEGVSAACFAGKGAVTASAATAVAGLASVCAVASGGSVTAAATRAGIGGAGPGTTAPGPTTTTRSTGSCCGSRGAGSAVAAARAGSSVTRNAGASARFFRHGNSKPGIPNPSSPKVRLNSGACISSESSSARVSRLRSALMRVCWRQNHRCPARYSSMPLRTFSLLLPTRFGQPQTPAR